ncbi:MAG TPA: ATP-binding protein, partial [Arenibaculum sp.]|nr:ATP-binding protein [Arenibaculum sp.]
MPYPVRGGRIDREPYDELVDMMDKPVWHSGMALRLRGWLPVMVVLTVGGTVGAIFAHSTSTQDAIHRHEVRAELNGEVRDVSRRLSRIVRDVARWGDAAAQLDGPDGVDGTWASRILGPLLRDMYPVSVIAMADGAGRVVHAFGPSAPPEGTSLPADGLGRLVERARAVATPEPRALAAFVPLSGKIHLAAATRLNRLANPPQPDAKDGFVLVFAIEVEQMMPLLRDRLGDRVRSVGFVPDGVADALSVPLVADDGAVLGAIVAEVDGPGTEMMRRTAPMLVAAMLLLALFGWLIRRQALAATKRLADAQRRLEGRNAEMARLTANLERARFEAEESNRAKSQFLAVISHELRTPMTGIVSAIELLRQTRLDERQTRFVDTLRNSAQLQLSLLNDILDYSKIEAGHLHMERIGFSPRAVLDDVVQLFAGPAAEKGVALSAVLAEDLPSQVVGDPNRLRQVLFNLVGNAIKFTSSGSVTVRAGRAGGDPATRATVPPAVTLRLSVEDTGIGIDPALRGRLFEPFVQGDASVTRLFGGTGLGLAICRQIVRRMGGEIGVEPNPGGGSRFWFTGEFDPPEHGERVAETIPPSPNTTGRQLLLAEDNETNRMLLTALLETLGHRVVAVGTGKAAVEAVEAGDYAAVLMDIEMPEMDGTSAARSIRSLPGPQGGVPIVALTGHADPRELRRIENAGFDAHLTKPVEIERLSGVLSDLLAGRPVALGTSGIADGAREMGAEQEGGEVNVSEYPILSEDRLVDLHAVLDMESLSALFDKFRATAPA